ncbi:hypothetical protein ANCDUO_26985, partial [Ancylostoma duodenale]
MFRNRCGCIVLYHRLVSQSCSYASNNFPKPLLL